MKILLLNFNLKGIGTFRRSFYFARELARHGHDATLMTVSRTSRWRPKAYFKSSWLHERDTPAGDGPWVRVVEGPNLGYKWLPGWGSGPLDVALRIREIAADGFDVVYGFEHHPNVSWPVYLTKPFKAYRFYSDWCDWFAGVGNWFRGVRMAHRIDSFLEGAIRCVARRVTTSSSLLKERAQRLGIPADHIVLVPEGAATDYVAPLPACVARQRVGLPLDRPIIGMGIDSYWREGLDAFNAARRRVPEALLLVIGRKQPGLSEYASQTGIADSVLETGWVSDQDYPACLAAADILFLIMKKDLYDLGRWPGKISDYLAAGRPTVTCNVGDAAEFIHAHQAGVLVETHDALADAIVHLLGDGDARFFYGARARAVACEELDWTRLGTRINSVVEQ